MLNESFHLMNNPLVILYIALLAIMIVLFVAGYIVVSKADKIIDKTFGIFLMVMSMMVSPVLFISGFMGRNDYISYEQIENVFLVVGFNSVIWATLFPLLLVPCCIIVFLIKEYENNLKTSERTLSQPFSIFKRINTKMNTASFNTLSRRGRNK